MITKQPKSRSETAETNLIAARELVLELWSERHEQIVPHNKFDAVVGDEAHQLAEFAVGADTRTHCILLASFLEDALLKCFGEFWSVGGKAEQEKYFGSNGPLSTFGQRTLVAKGLRWLEPKEALEMDLLRKIRNAFAHDHRIHALAEEPLVGYASSLFKREEIWTKSKINGYAIALDAAPLETKLRMRVFCAGMFLVGSVIARAKRISVEVPPDFRPQGGWEAMLWIEQALIDAAIRYCWRVLGLEYSGANYVSPNGTAIVEHSRTTGG